MFHALVCGFLCCLIPCLCEVNLVEKHKRQLFREDLLPTQGGKIPDYAFRTDRLSLNRLQQHGLFSREGVLWDHIEPARSNHPRQYLPKTIKVTLPSTGNALWDSPRLVDTTYIIREPVALALKPLDHQKSLPLVPRTSQEIAAFFRSASKLKNTLTPERLSAQVLEKLAKWL